ncbi:hypothetical protein [Marivirga sp.]|uniref:hypothetical protein n=1 Tax=Marivirga sp. TaxID=2018662 RepID=UPI003DA6D958
MSYKFNYKRAFEQRCFQLIIEAYKTTLSERVIQLDWNENDISSEIHRHIKENPLRITWKVSSNVESHIPKNIPKVKGFADKFPRIDFRLTTFSQRNEYDYFFEAKNIKQNDYALKRRYINTGINNFISKKYENGSLIGYLLEGKIDATVKGINTLLEKTKEKQKN